MAYHITIPGRTEDYRNQPRDEWPVQEAPTPPSPYILVKLLIHFNLYILRPKNACRHGYMSRTEWADCQASLDVIVQRRYPMFFHYRNTTTYHLVPKWLIISMLWSPLIYFFIILSLWYIVSVWPSWIQHLPSLKVPRSTNCQCNLGRGKNNKPNPTVLK